MTVRMGALTITLLTGRHRQDATDFDRAIISLSLLVGKKRVELAAQFNEWIKTQIYCRRDGMHYCIELAKRDAPLPWEQEE